jgi:crossover junction endodeoxyribonuclease RusA
VIRLEVVGTPQPQGNKTAFVRGGRAVLVEGRRAPAREAFKSWRDAIATAGRDWQLEHGQELLDDPAAIDITFRLPRPRSAPKRRVYPDSRPDLDKLARAVLDGLTGIIISNDSRVVDLSVRKRFAVDCPPGATITIGAAA